METRIDAHAHLVGPDSMRESVLVAALRARSFRWLNLCWLDDEETLPALVALARSIHQRHAGQVSWATTFSLRGFGEPGWVDRTVAQIDSGARSGAVAVKVWKNIGMTLRVDGRFVMIDDPRFDPVLDHIERLGLTLAAHIGEPRNCWLPLDRMTMAADRSYYGAHPQYHGLKHPEVPPHEAQVDSLMRVVKRHPGLRVVGCHLASLEYDVREIARALERHPNLAVDTAGRLCHLQGQERGAVRDFFQTWQDRILYGTDEALDLAGSDPDRQVAEILSVYDQDERYLAGGEPVDAPRVAPGFRCDGLGLPPDILRKVFHDNAVAWYPGLTPGA